MYLNLIINLILQISIINTNNLHINVAYHKYSLSVKTISMANEVIYFWMLLHFDLNFFKFIETVI